MKCRKCGNRMLANTERMPGFDFSTRVFECGCGFKKNVLTEEDHEKWEKAEKVVSKCGKSSYNYLRCLDRPEKPGRTDDLIDKQKKSCCGNNDDCGGGSCSSGGCGSGGSGGCGGCKH